ncbi:hypothetical protein RRG08_024712 [Elysia crispata]|uniref:Uncharacterized protein n=1 Tax=Elysia crispata TaxID=231223 RepID=A0AAE1CX04_9GAST|nr:hypothetical protein RRG08_024712 [Elysia crispata]
MPEQFHMASKAVVPGLSTVFNPASNGPILKTVGEHVEDIQSLTIRGTVQIRLKLGSNYPRPVMARKPSPLMENFDSRSCGSNFIGISVFWRYFHEVLKPSRFPDLDRPGLAQSRVTVKADRYRCIQNHLYLTPLGEVIQPQPGPRCIVHCDGLWADRPRTGGLVGYQDATRPVGSVNDSESDNRVTLIC